MMEAGGNRKPNRLRFSKLKTTILGLVSLTRGSLAQPRSYHTVQISANCTICFSKTECNVFFLREALVPFPWPIKTRCPCPSVRPVFFRIFQKMNLKKTDLRLSICVERGPKNGSEVNTSCDVDLTSIILHPAGS